MKIEKIIKLIFDPRLSNSNSGQLIQKFDSGGIRTHATEVTGALNQRLRPLGHAILSPEKNIIQVMIGTNATCSDYSERAVPNRLAYEVDI